MKKLLNPIIAKECSTSICGFHFLCIFGKHINGGFLAIPNWNICVELSDDINDFAYNAYNNNQIYTAIRQIKEFNGYYEKIADTLADKIRKEGY